MPKSCESLGASQFALPAMPREAVLFTEAKLFTKDFIHFHSFSFM